MDLCLSVIKKSELLWCICEETWFLYSPLSIVKGEANPNLNIWLNFSRTTWKHFDSYVTLKDFFFLLWRVLWLKIRYWNSWNLVICLPANLICIINVQKRGVLKWNLALVGILCKCALHHRCHRLEGQTHQATFAETKTCATCASRILQYNLV